MIDRDDRWIQMKGRQTDRQIDRQVARVRETEIDIDNKDDRYIDR